MQKQNWTIFWKLRQTLQEKSNIQKRKMCIKIFWLRKWSQKEDRFTCYLFVMPIISIFWIIALIDYWPTSLIFWKSSIRVSEVNWVWGEQDLSSSILVFGRKMCSVWYPKIDSVWIWILYWGHNPWFDCFSHGRFRLRLRVVSLGPQLCDCTALALGTV